MNLKLFYVVIAITLLYAFPAQAHSLPIREGGDSNLPSNEGPLIEDNEVNINMMLLPTLKQTDPRWASVKLGTEGRTIGSHGCTITALTMALNNWAIFKTPDVVVKELTAVEAFMPSGDLIWSRVSLAYPSLTFIWRQYTVKESPQYTNRQNMDAAAKKVNRLMELGQPVLLNVDILGNGSGNHWVVAYDGDATAAGPRIKDPATGKDQLLSERYGDFSTAIYGYAVLVASPQGIPDWSNQGAVAQALGKAGEVKRLSASLPESRLKVLSSEIVDTLLSA